MTPEQDIIAAHLDWLSGADDEDGGDTSNAVLERTSQTFTLVLGKRDQEAIVDDAGTYKRAGTELSAFVRHDAPVSLRVADVVQYAAWRWRVMKVSPQTGRRHELVATDVLLEALEN